MCTCSNITTLTYVCIYFRCHIVSQFNDGLYDYIIASDETLLFNPTNKSQDTTHKKYGNICVVYVIVQVSHGIKYVVFCCFNICQTTETNPINI